MHLHVITGIHGMRKGPLCAKHDFFVIFQTATIPRPQSSRLSTWFIGSLGLLCTSHVDSKLEATARLLS